jgi:hypothetical protein
LNSGHPFKIIFGIIVVRRPQFFKSSLKVTWYYQNRQKVTFKLLTQIDLYEQACLLFPLGDTLALYAGYRKVLVLTEGHGNITTLMLWALFTGVPSITAWCFR